MCSNWITPCTEALIGYLLAVVFSVIFGLCFIYKNLLQMQWTGFIVVVTTKVAAFIATLLDWEGYPRGI